MTIPFPSLQPGEKFIIDLKELGRFFLHLEFFGKHGEFCYQTVMAACADIPAQEGTAVDEPEWHRTNKCWVLQPGTQATIGSGIKIAAFVPLYTPCPLVLPKLLVKGRSSLSKRRIYAHMGTIDMDYIDREIKVILENRGTEPYIIQPGDRIAQMELGLCLHIPGIENKCQNREGGFGSTGV